MLAAAAAVLSVGAMASCVSFPAAELDAGFTASDQVIVCGQSSIRVENTDYTDNGKGGAFPLDFVRVLDDAERAFAAAYPKVPMKPWLLSAGADSTEEARKGLTEKSRLIFLSVTAEKDNIGLSSKPTYQLLARIQLIVTDGAGKDIVAYPPYTQSFRYDWNAFRSNPVSVLPSYRAAVVQTVRDFVQDLKSHM